MGDMPNPRCWIALLLLVTPACNGGGDDAPSVDARGGGDGRQVDAARGPDGGALDGSPLDGPRPDGPPPALRANLGMAIRMDEDRDIAFPEVREELDARWVRLDFEWRFIEPNAPVAGAHAYRLGQRDDAIADANGAGLHVLGLIGYAPCWARPTDPATGLCVGADGTDGHWAPTDAHMADYAALAGYVAERYDGDGTDDAPGSPVVDAWELWNEPNKIGFWKDGVGADRKVNPERYARLLRLASVAIKAANPDAVVVSGGIAPGVDSADGARVSPITYLERLYASADGLACGDATTPRSCFDALGFHPYFYIAPLGLDAEVSSNAWQQMAWQDMPQPRYPADWPLVAKRGALMPSLRQLMEAHGDADRSIWATEVGVPVSDGTRPAEAHVTAEFQAIQSAEMVRRWRDLAWAGPLFYFKWTQLGTGVAADDHHTFGLVATGSVHPSCEADGTPTTIETTRAFCELRRLVRGAYRE